MYNYFLLRFRLKSVGSVFVWGELAVTHTLIEGGTCASKIDGTRLSDICCQACRDTSLECLDYESYIVDYYGSCSEAVTSFHSVGKVNKSFSDLQ